jgi:hypothetical protein
MQVSVKHNGSTITSRVINYTREHKICTSIGTLDITLEGTYSTSIDPWDEIDIYENGNFQVKYYVSDVSHSVPSGTITIQCQDNSKRLVDYFIPDSYTIDYPSYTRYWIQKFLDEAGISYSFLTSSQGNLLSNYTALGLQPAYDQIMNLLQLSGWYMYFDGDGIAVIGSLDVDLANTAGSLGLTDILDIKKVENDKMLRNRALVWGEYDVFRQEYAFADVTKMTPWNYDSADVRTMVVSNQNIPNSSSAYNIANILVKEFAKITIEKHITAWGARNFVLGDALRIDSHVWQGKGLITTFGVTLDRNGLVTNIVLDERCPRLFGFFNFGDYVYVGTFGDGIWRKHIKFDPTWYDFSAGLLNLNITDLHINNGMFGAVSHSGEMYYTNTEEGPWYPITTPTGLMSSLDDEVVGSGIVLTSFSGIMARATIVDHTTNTIKFGVDTWSGLNTGDYFLTYSGIVSSTDSTTMSGNRGWILEYDPFTGQLVGDIGSGIYPIVYSGSYDMQVLDLENDGRNDYVSVKTGADPIETDGLSWNYGSHTSQSFAATTDINGFSILPQNIQNVNNNIDGAIRWTQSVKDQNSLVAYDNELSDIIEVVSMGQSISGAGGKFTRNKMSRTIIDPEVTTDINRVTVTSAGTGIAASDRVLGLARLGTDLYRAYWFQYSAGTFTVKYQDWDAQTNTLGSETTLASTSVEQNNSIAGTAFSILAKNGKAYVLMLYNDSVPGTSISVQNYLQMYVFSVELETGVFVSDHVLKFSFPADVTTGDHFFLPTSPMTESGANKGICGQDGATGNLTTAFARLFQDGDGVPKVTGWFQTHYHRFDNLLTPPYNNSAEEYIITGNATTVNVSRIYANFNIVGDIAEQYWNLGGVTGEDFNDSQLSGNIGVVCLEGVMFGTTNSIAFNGTSFVHNVSATPTHLKYSNIFPILTSENYYVSKDGSTFYLSDAAGLGQGTAITPPTDYTLWKPYSNPINSLSNYVYFLADNADFITVLVPFSNGTFLTNYEIELTRFGLATSRGTDIGCIFMSEPSDFGVSNPVSSVSYLDMLVPIESPGYLVLQRRGSEFHLVQESTKPIRIDISNNSPVLTVLDVESTFISNFVYDNELTQISPLSTPSGVINEVRDYRYTLLETASGMIVSSGAGVETQILYVRESGVFFSDANSYSGGFVVFDTISSGLAERIETTNYVYPGQFIFVTTSGENPEFYQRDNDGLTFDTYSGLPDSRATIIRCDDRL